MKYEEEARLRRERRAMGVCTSCGGAINGKYITCDACREKARKKYLRKLERHAQLYGENKEDIDESIIIKAYGCGEHTINEVIKMTGCSYKQARFLLPLSADG